METLVGVLLVSDLVSESRAEIGKRVERFNIRENLRKFERRVVAQLGSGHVPPFANFAYFGS
jgi:hypothetical protein